MSQRNSNEMSGRNFAFSTVECSSTNRNRAESNRNGDSFDETRPLLVKDVERQHRRRQDYRYLTYPKAVMFVLLSKFFESFAANGVRTVFVLYLHDSLMFGEDSATVYFHVFNFFSQFCPVFGAVLADNYFGDVKTIFYLFFPYACGWIGMIILTAFSFQNVSNVPLIISSLILISIGNGSIRACVATLGGAQFQLPAQSQSLHRYFSHYYFVYTLGILLSKIVPPEIREHTQFFGQENCYLAVFGSLASIFSAAWIVFLLGMFFYKQENIATDSAQNNMLFQVISCIYRGVRYKLKNVREHTWIDGAKGYYSENFVQQVSDILKVLNLFIPLPMYWALYTQIDSTWTFQSSQLNRTIFGYEIEADQVKAIGPFLLLLLIPLWEKIFHPLLQTICNIHLSPLVSIFMGGLSAALSFFCAATLQFYIENCTGNISIFWQLPQFVLLMLGEVWLSIPGLNFSFTQSPPSMRSVMTAAWFCNNAFGNLIVVLLTELHLFRLASIEFLLYAMLMTLAMAVFGWLASKYKYSDYELHCDDNQNALQQEQEQEPQRR